MEDDVLKSPVPKTKLYQDMKAKSVRLEEIDDVKVLNIKNNYYEIYTKEGETLLFIIYPQEVKIQKTNKFTHEGEPVYNVSIQQRLNLMSFEETLLGKIESEADDFELSSDDG
ncbi:MAG: hypothetical protein H7643_05260 [Candidatus Heimdallarchaeota archaeon]|nr:hypothetical protein [Candidatus Heimdallarchaeota archaeon]